MPQRGERARDVDDDDVYDAEAGMLESGFAGKSTFLAGEAEAELMAEAGVTLPPREQIGDEEQLGSEQLRGEAEDAMALDEPTIDLTRDVIDEGSLFDQPRSEGDGVRRPALRVNEVDATLDRNQRAERARKKRGASQG